MYIFFKIWIDFLTIFEEILKKTHKFRTHFLFYTVTFNFNKKKTPEHAMINWWCTCQYFFWVNLIPFLSLLPAYISFRVCLFYDNADHLAIAVPNTAWSLIQPRASAWFLLLCLKWNLRLFTAFQCFSIFLRVWVVIHRYCQPLELGISPSLINCMWDL